MAWGIISLGKKKIEFLQFQADLITCIQFRGIAHRLETFSLITEKVLGIDVRNFACTFYKPLSKICKRDFLLSVTKNFL